MKRFYCTICKKVKRVRKFPLDVQHVDSSIPGLRTGTCAKHYDYTPRKTGTR